MSSSKGAAKGASATTNKPAPQGGGGKGKQQPQQQNNPKGGNKGGAADHLGGGAKGKQQQNQNGGNKGGQNPQQQGKGAANGSVAAPSKYPRLDIDKENEQIASLTAQINECFAQLDKIRLRLDELQKERKELSAKNRETLDTKQDASAKREKAKLERDALRKQLDQLKEVRKRKLQELNKAKGDLPVKVNSKESKRVVELNMARLNEDEAAIENKIKHVVTTGQDRAHSKELQAIKQKKRQVQEWAKQAAEAEAPIDPTLKEKLALAEDEVKKYFEEERETRQESGRFKEAVASKTEDIEKVKEERTAIALKIDKLKGERDAAYEAIRRKRKENQDKVKQIQKEEREKRGKLEKERRQKTEKEKLERKIRELADAFKEDIARCDRLTAFLTNHQAKQKKEAETEDNHEHEGEEEDKAEEAEEKEDEEVPAQGESSPTKGKKKGFRLTMPLHVDFELISVRPPATLEDFPTTLESITRRKAFYERLAGVKAEKRKELEAQLQALENGTNANSGKKQQQQRKDSSKNGKVQKHKLADVPAEDTQEGEEPVKADTSAVADEEAQDAEAEAGNE